MESISGGARRERLHEFFFKSGESLSKGRLGIDLYLSVGAAADSRPDPMG
jgi:hypothetical protein